MKAALFSMGSESSKRIAEALKTHFEQVDMVDIRRIEMRLGKGDTQLFYDGEPMENNYDCVYLKSSFRYAMIQQALADYFNKKAYMPIQPASFNIVNDKMLTHLYLEKASVPTPETYVTPTVEAAKKLLSNINFPIILKIPGGTHGKGVMFAESIATASGILDTLSELKQAVLIQEYIETNGTDIRAFVIGNDVVAGMVRKAGKDEKRANLHAGGSAESVSLDAKTKKVALNSARALGAEICAVDILESVKGPVVLEANLSPGLQGIMNATGLNIDKKIADFLYKKTLEFKKMPDVNAQSIVEESAGLEQNIVSKLDFRGERIYLSQLVTKLSNFRDEDEVIIKVKKGKIEIEKE